MSAHEMNSRRANQIMIKWMSCNTIHLLLKNRSYDLKSVNMLMVNLILRLKKLGLSGSRSEDSKDTTCTYMYMALPNASMAKSLTDLLHYVSCMKLL